MFKGEPKRHQTRQSASGDSRFASCAGAIVSAESHKTDTTKIDFFMKMCPFRYGMGRLNGGAVIARPAVLPR